jgi:threonine synthase
MGKSGKTPLLRAKNLEKMVSVGEIYIKLEGTNPTGHKFDRITEVLIRDAVKQGYQKVLVDGTKSYIRSVMYFAQDAGVNVHVPLFKNQKWKSVWFEKANILDFRKDISVHPRVLLNEFAKHNNFYYIDQGSANTIISDLTLQKLTFECLKKLSYQVTTIFTQLGYGYTLASIYSAVLKSWVDDNIERLPQIFYGADPKVKDIIESYEKNLAIHPSELRHLKSRKNEIVSNFSFSEYDKDLLEICFKAIMETEGEMVSVKEDELKEAVKLIKKIENITVSKEEAYPIAAFIRNAKAGRLKTGRHIIILNDAKSEIFIRRVENFKDMSKEDLVSFTKECLAEYGEDLEATYETIEHAKSGGFILVAYRDSIPQGICIITNLGVKHYLAPYHLGYIGVKAGNKGRGVATELLKQAIDITNGQISLHVATENTRAKRLYEKMGFRGQYYRMIYDETFN